MGFDITLAGIISLLSLGVAVSSFLRAHQRDKAGDTRQLESRIRALEDGMLQLEHYAQIRRELPGRLAGVEYELRRLQEAVERLESGRGASDD